MRRILSLALALVMLLSMTACIGKKIVEALQPTPEPTAVPTEVPTPEPTEVPTPTPEPTPKPLEAADIVGIWTLTKIKYGDSIIAASDFNMELYLEFLENGTVNYVSITFGEYEEETSAFTINDYQILLKDSDEPITYDPEKDELSFLLEEASNDKNMEVILSRTPDAVIPTAPEPAAEEGLASKIIGTWNLSYAMVGEMKVGKELLGETKMTLVFKEDGSAVLSNQEQTLDTGLTWKTESETAIGLYAYDVMKVYEINYIPETNELMLLEEQSGVKMYFEKTE